MSVESDKGYINVIDITDKNNPFLISNLDLNSSRLSAFRFNTDETKLFVSSRYRDYNDKIYEILEQYEDVELLGVTPKSSYTSSDELMLIENETIMLAISYYKIDIIDITNPSNPVVLKTIQLESPPG